MLAHGAADLIDHGGKHLISRVLLAAALVGNRVENAGLIGIIGIKRTLAVTAPVPLASW